MAIRAYGSLQPRLLPETARSTQKLSGLTEGEATYEIYGPRSQIDEMKDALPNINSAHPLGGWLYMERRVLTLLPAGLRAECHYAGCEDVDLDRPVYSLSIGEEEVPIEVHPKFVSDIGGQPSSPKNGALFTDASGALTANNTTGVFAGFSTMIISGMSVIRNPYAGIEAYLDSVNIVWRQRYVTRTMPDISTEGLIDPAPPGPVPGFSNRNWRYCGFTSEMRGRTYLTLNPAKYDPFIVYEIAREWKLSGRGGWNSTIYSA